MGGPNLLDVFFGDLTSIIWSGQFNLDFLCYLLLSGLWISWRNNFSMKGIILGILASVGGILVLAPYLFVLSYKVNGNFKELLTGKVNDN